MKRILFSFCLISACSLIACGDDSSSGPKQDDSSSLESSSSSEKAKSSSSKDEKSSSSSSKEKSSSSLKEGKEVNSDAEENSGSGNETDAPEQDKSSSSSKSKDSTSNSKTHSANYDPEKKLLTDDRDGEVYKTVKIGDQIWMAENLRFTPKEPVEGCEMLYLDSDEDTTAFAKYGRHYPWIDAMMLSCDSIQNADMTQEQSIKHPHQGICPNGWHIPSQEDWLTLAESVNITDLLSTEWVALEYTGTDLYGFNVLPRQKGESIVGYIISESSSDRGAVAYFDDYQSYPIFKTAYNIMTTSRFYLRCLMD